MMYMQAVIIVPAPTSVALGELTIIRSADKSLWRVHKPIILPNIYACGQMRPNIQES